MAKKNRKTPPVAQMAPAIVVEAIVAEAITPAEAIEVEIEAITPASKRIEGIGFDLLGLVGAKMTHEDKDKAIQAAVVAIDEVRVVVLNLEQDNKKMLESAEAVVASNDDLVAAKAALEVEVEAAKKALDEAITANAEFAGIDEELGKAKAEIKELQATLKKAPAAAKKEAANDIKLAKAAADEAKAALKKFQDEMEAKITEATAEANDKLASIRTDLLKAGIKGSADFDAMVTAAAEHDALKVKYDKTVAELVAARKELAATGSGVEPIESSTTPGGMPGIFANMIEDLIASGADPVRIAGLMPRIQGVAAAFVKPIIDRLLAAGVVTGEITEDLVAAMSTMKESPIRPVEGKSNEMIEALVATLEKLNPSAMSAELDRKEAVILRLKERRGDSTLDASRRRLQLAFGEVENGVYEHRLPKMVGFAIREVGGRMMALAHSAALRQPFALLIKTEAGLSNIIATRVVDSGDHLEVYRPDEKVGGPEYKMVLVDGDAIVAVHKAPSIVAADGTTPESFSVAVAASRGFSPGTGSMALPRHQRNVVGVDGKPMNVPLVDLDRIYAALQDEAGALAD